MKGLRKPKLPAARTTDDGSVAEAQIVATLTSGERRQKPQTGAAFTLGEGLMKKPKTAAALITDDGRVEALIAATFTLGGRHEKPQTAVAFTLGEGREKKPQTAVRFAVDEGRRRVCEDQKALPLLLQAKSSNQPAMMQSSI